MIEPQPCISVGVFVAVSLLLCAFIVVDVADVVDKGFCSSKEDGYFSLRSDCSRYVECSQGGKLRTLSCPAGTFFSDTNGFCTLDINNSMCTSKASSLTAHRDVGHVHPQVHTHTQQPVLFDFAPPDVGMNFDPFMNNVDYPSDLDLPYAPMYVLPFPQQLFLPVDTHEQTGEPPSSFPVTPLYFDQKRRTILSGEELQSSQKENHQIFYVPVAFVNPSFTEVEENSQDTITAINSFIDYLANTVGAVPVK